MAEQKKAPVNSPAFYGVRDTRRRGEPLPYCDCIQCFGYCINRQFVRDDGGNRGEKNGESANGAARLQEAEGQAPY